MLRGCSEQANDSHCRGGAEQGAQAICKRDAVGLHHDLRLRRRFTDAGKHALVKLCAERIAGGFRLIGEQLFVPGKMCRQDVLSEESAQNALLLCRGGRLPVAFQKLFDIFIVHDALILSIRV